MERLANMPFFKSMPFVMLLACMGAGLSVIADIFSRYSPDAVVNSMFISIEDIKHFGTAKTLRQLEIGQIIAFFSIPLSALSVIPIWKGFEKTHFKTLKNIFAVSFCLSCFLGLVFHTLITAISFVFIKEKQGLLILTSMDIDLITNLFNVVLKGSIISALFSNACFTLIVFRSSTVFSKASAIISPILIATVLIIMGLNASAPFAAFFYIVSGNLGLLVWYLIIYKSIDRKEVLQSNEVVSINLEQNIKFKNHALAFENK